MKKLDFVSIDDLSNNEILEIFKLADELEDIYEKRTAIDLLRGKIMATLFYEPSTRTRLSFETAMLRLGGQVISAADMAASSSAAKGETIADTAKVVSQYADVIAIRHPRDGSAVVAARHSDVPVINAGDGTHEHPTQTLCDLYTLRRTKGEIKGQTVALFGDLRFGRTIHSLAAALARFGAELILIPGRGLELPEHLLRRLAIKYKQRLHILRGDLEFINEKLKNFDALYIGPREDKQEPLFALDIKVDLSKKVPKWDVVYMTRYQKERLARDQPSRDYPKLDSDFLRRPQLKNAILMHPLPRVDEIPQSIDSDPRSKYFQQVSYGVIVRMALLQFLMTSHRLSLVGFEPIPVKRIYRNTHNVGPRCLNKNCVSSNENEPGLVSEFSIMAREKTYASHLLILECQYCEFECSVSIVGNSKSKKFCQYDPALEKYVEHWLSQEQLILFNDEAEATRHGFTPYKKGPQISLMSAEDISDALEKIANEIADYVPDLGELRLIGLKNRGDIIAQRIASILERRFAVKVPVASLDVLPFRDDVHVTGQPKDTIDFTLDEKTVVLVDDVLFSGRTTN